MNLSKPNTFEVAQIYGSGCTKVRDNRKKVAGTQGGEGGQEKSPEELIHHSQSTSQASLMETYSGCSCQHKKLISILSSPTIRTTPATCWEIDLEHLATGQIS